MYAVIPVTIVFIKLQYTGKSTLLQMWGHFILSYANLMYRRIKYGGHPDQSCAGEDMPETVAKLYRESSIWLGTEQEDTN